MIEFKQPDFLSQEIPSRNIEIEGEIKSRFDKLAKPIDGLGSMESLFARIGSIQSDSSVPLDPSVAVIFCGDHGVVSEDVSQSDAEVTLAIAKGLGEGRSSANYIAKYAGCEVLPIDCGIKLADEIPGVVNRKIDHGTADLFKGAAMSKGNARKAISVGFETVQDLKEKGYKLILAGEMGIGNTTSAAAILCGLTGEYPELVVGRGSGISDEGYNNKTMIVRSVVQHRNLIGMKPMELLSQVGGYEIAALTGLFIGGAVFGLPVISDGLITGAAALLAARMRPEVKDYLIFSQKGHDPGTRLVLKELDTMPPIDADVHMGEGVGGMLLLTLLRAVKEFYDHGDLFADVDIQPYKRYRAVTKYHYE